MPSSAECSPDTPWGIHQEVVDNGCPRCGWRADGRPSEQRQLQPEPVLAA